MFIQYICINWVYIQDGNDGETPDSSENDVHSDYIASDSDDEAIQKNDVVQQESSKLKYITYLLWFCFWFTCWLIAIELRFGIVYLLFSALFGVYFNTRTGPKAKNEVSAYSVFNENCESINGTLKAEQFDQEIRYGPMSVQH